jgi:Uma2 family endonuclease
MAAVFQPAKTLFTIDQFYKMGEAGVFRPDQRIELIDGELIEMAPIGARHVQAVNRLTRMLVVAYGEGAVVSVQNPVALRPRSLPQPDLAVLRPQANERGHGLPEPPDTLLVIEVADTTIDWDRRVKMSLYARAGVPRAWLVDVGNERVEAYSLPGPDGYADCAIAAHGQSLELPGLPDARVQVTEIFG